MERGTWFGLLWLQRRTATYHMVSLESWHSTTFYSELCWSDDAAELLSKIVEWTNEDISILRDHTSEADLRSFIGVMFAMTLQSTGNTDDYWMEEDNGVAAWCFSIIKKFARNSDWALKFHLQRSQDVTLTWHSLTISIPICSTSLLLDLKYAWIYPPLADAKYPNGPPALTHQKSKPGPVSFYDQGYRWQGNRHYFWHWATGKPHAMALKEFSDGIMPTTAWILRLSKSLFGTAPFHMLTPGLPIWKLSKRGNYYCGMLKTGHSGTPQKYMQSQAFSNDLSRGARKTLHLGTGMTKSLSCLEWAWVKVGKKSKGTNIFLANCPSAAQGIIYFF